MTPEELEAIKARCEAATPGPWTHNERFSGHCTNRSRKHKHDGESCEVAGAWVPLSYFSHDIYSKAPGQPQIAGNYDFEEGGIFDESDAAFIAHARSDIPALLAYIKELETELAAHACPSCIRFRCARHSDLGEMVEEMNQVLREARESGWDGTLSVPLTDEDRKRFLAQEALEPDA